MWKEELPTSKIIERVQVFSVDADDGDTGGDDDDDDSEDVDIKVEVGEQFNVILSKRHWQLRVIKPLLCWSVKQT